MALGRRPSLDTGGLDTLPTGLKGTWEIQKRYTGYNLAYKIGKDLGVRDKKKCTRTSCIMRLGTADMSGNNIKGVPRFEKLWWVNIGGVCCGVWGGREPSIYDGGDFLPRVLSR